MDCDNKDVVSCDKYLTRDCNETCAYSKEARGYGVGAMEVPVGGLIDKLNEGGKNGKGKKFA